MFDGVYRDWEPNRPQGPSSLGLWLLVALLGALPVALVMLSLVAAVRIRKRSPADSGDNSGPAASVQSRSTARAT